MSTKICAVVLLSFLFAINILAQNTRTFSGTVVTQQFELIPNVFIEIETSSGKITARTDAEGAFSAQVPIESLSVKFFGNNTALLMRIFGLNESLENC